MVLQALCLTKSAVSSIEKSAGVFAPTVLLGYKSMSTNGSDGNSGDGEQYACPTCEAGFQKNRGLKIHHSRAHGESISGTEVECSNCGEVTRKKRCRVERFENQYCSRECMGEHQRRQATVECVACGEEIDRHESRIERSENLFCDGICYGDWLRENQTGEDHPNWDGGAVYYYGPSWKRQRTKARERDGGQCRVCGASEYLDVHHIRPFKQFGIGRHEEANRLENLVTLCPPHHARWEGIPLRPQ